MIKEVFPEGQAIFIGRHCTPELFSLTIDQISSQGNSFTGILRIDEPETAFFLFFLTGDPYAAGGVINGRPVALSINDFLQHLALGNNQRTLSLYKTDPVLFKSMLVFFQKQPSANFTTDMVDIKDILIKIKEEKISALIILKKNSMHSFFYLHSGEPKMAHFADKSVVQDQNPIDEQMISYSYPPDKISVEAIVYLDIKTSEAGDASGIKSFLISVSEKTEQLSSFEAGQKKIKTKEGRQARIRLEITGGPQKGNKFNIPLPFTIGRRDADIRIRDMSISNRHASLEVSGDKIIFKDLNSANGSMVNGKIVNEIELSDGDTIQMGDTILKIHFVSN